jgi:primosomal protein N' (replication factor Y) (superfamily II helicase)
MHYYDVAPTKIVRTDSQFFTYASNDSLSNGTIVKIPVGKKELLGVVIKASTKPKFDTKAITSVVESLPLPQPLLNTALWMSNYYATHLALILSTILPTGVDKKRHADKSTPEPLVSIRKNLQRIPNRSQQTAIDGILSSNYGTQILHGITGSGKTLVYIECAKKLFNLGKSTVVLVPEISLTSQIVDEFTQIFGDNVILTHSRQTERERHAVWSQVLASKTPKIIIGPRSALFMPIQQLGLIIVDESHEPSYKQEQSPRYSALRVATVLAAQHGSTTLFGSATPLVSDYYIAKQRNAPIYRLDEHAVVGSLKSTTLLVDMTKKLNFSRHRFLSDKLLTAIEQTLEQNKQVLIFHNRRGTTAVTMCKNCGWMATDPDTDIPLTLHADKHLLLSHTSAFSMQVPTHCPVCGEVDIIHKGIGTKLLESELSKLFPNKKIVRYDGDSSNDAGIADHYQELYDGSIDIIIGTQVVAKGLDLPNLLTVGVIQADTGLALPDFSSDERTFQLLAQVVGRVGRTNKPTTVVVQSYHPSHIAITAGLSQDYSTFYNDVLKRREAHGFPPFTYLLKLVCVYKTEAAAIKNAKLILTLLRNNAPDYVTFSGPSPSFYEKQHGNYHWQIVAKSPSRSQLLAVIKLLPKQHWQYELDPVNLL